MAAFPSKLRLRMQSALLGVLCAVVHGWVAGQQVFPVKVDGKWGLIDNAGSPVTAAEYESAALSTGGFCLVVKGGKFGLYDNSGVQSLPCEFTFIRPVNAQLWTVNRGGDCQEGDCRGGKWGLYHHPSKTLMKPAFDLILPYDSNGVALANVGGNCGYQDCKGGVWALLDMSARTLMEPQFLQLKPLGRIVLVKAATGWGAYDLQSKKLVVPTTFDTLNPIRPDWLCGVRQGKASVLRMDGTVVAKESQFPVFEHAGEGFLRFQVDKKWGLADSSGRELIPAEFDKVDAKGQGWVLLKREERYALARTDGKVLGEPVFTTVTDFGKTWAQVGQGLGEAFLDTTGKFIIPFGFTQVQAICDTTFMYSDRQIMRWAGLDGKVRKGIAFEEFYPYQNGVAKVKTSGKWGLVNVDGNWVANPKFSQVHALAYVAQAKTEGQDWQYFYYDEFGRPSNVKRIVLEKEEMGGATSLTGQRVTGNGAWASGDWGDRFAWFVESRKWGVRDRRLDSTMIRPKFQDVVLAGPSGLFLVTGKIGETEELGYGIVNMRTGTETAPLAFSDIYIDEFDTTGVARAVYAGSGKYTLIRSNGAPIKLAGLTHIRPFSEQFAAACLGGNQVQLGVPRYDSLKQVHLTDKATREIRTEFRYLETGKWGYLRNDGTWAKQPEYEQAMPFRNGKARVKLNGKWGLIDSLFQWVVTPAYDFIEPVRVDSVTDFFLAGYEQDRWGFIDSTGKIKVKPLFQEAGAYREGMVKIKIDGLWGFADLTGQVVIEPRYKEVGDFHDGRARVRNGRKWGYVDMQGNMVIPELYLRAGDFHQGRAWVQDAGMMAYVDVSGQRVTEPLFTYAGDFKEGVAPVKSKGAVGLVDLEGEIVLPPKYYKVHSIQDSMVVVQEGGNYGLYRLGADMIVKPQYRGIGLFSEGLAAFRDGMQYGYLDSAGNIIIQPAFANAGPFSCGLAPVFIQGRWGFINTSGDVIIQAEYQSVGSFSDGLAPVKSGKKWGFIDKEGKVVVPITYDKVLSFESGCAPVFRTNVGWGVVNKEGTIVVECNFESIGKFKNGLAPVCKDRKWGVINQYGTFVSLMKYDKIGNYENGLAKVLMRRKFGVLSDSGKVIAEPVYDLAEKFNGLIRVEANDEVGYLNLNGKWVWQPGK